MIKTLKWIYELGYKHAENKLYNQMMRAIGKEAQTIFEKFEIEKKSDYERKELQKREAIAWELKSIVDDVFHPITTMPEPEVERNRFEL